ncbi:MAG: methylated-DNA-[protein]-cysteine S-methyltransferase [Pseudomonadota bacterium]|nr:methylated-DNA-[protein]-cysteine S-methyltransferase [Pseudomonadota bacterium]
MAPTPAPTLGLALFATALGACGMAWSAQAICGVQLPYARREDTLATLLARFPGCGEVPPPDWVRAVMADVVAQLQGDAQADARLGAVPLDMALAPPFHQQVWQAARRIPMGQTLRYGELAALLGQPGAARAVGQALGANPFAPIVPCHRVLAKGQGGGGFSAPGGVDTKLRMLEVERAHFGSPGLFDAL